MINISTTYGILIMDTPSWMKYVPMVDKLHSNALQTTGTPLMHKSEDGVCYYDHGFEHPVMNGIVYRLRKDFPDRNVQFLEFCGESKLEFNHAIGLLRASNPKFIVTITSVMPDERIVITAYSSEEKCTVNPVLTPDRLYDVTKSAIQNNQATIVHTHKGH